MKRAAILLSLCLLTGCGHQAATHVDSTTATTTATAHVPPTIEATTIPRSSPTPTPAPPPATPTALPIATDVPEEIVAWLQSNAVPFDTARPGSGCADLQPLLEMIGDARIVALGEATHGTCEFFAMKHRILECLVEERGFSLFLVEDQWHASNQVNQYVETGEGDADRALRELSSIWQTDEVLGLIQWMRRFNENSPPDAMVSFRGFDMSDGYHALVSLTTYIDEVDPEASEFVEGELRCFRTYYASRRQVPQLTEALYQRCREGVRNVYEWLVSRSAAYEGLSAAIDYAEAVHVARLLVQNEQFRSNPAEGSNLRDASMAENVVWLLEQAGPEARAIIWAHNGHVQANPVPIQFYGDEMPRPVHGVWVPMGAHLREPYGDSMVVVGFTFLHGAFNARGIDSATGSTTPFGPHQVMPPVPGSYEPYLAIPGLPRYILDLRPTFLDETVRDWFGETRWLRGIGWAYDRDNVAASTMPIVLPQAFDVIIYFEESRPSTLRR